MVGTSKKSVPEMAIDIWSDVNVPQIPTLTWMEVLMINLLNALLELPTDSDGTIFLKSSEG